MRLRLFAVATLLGAWTSALLGGELALKIVDKEPPGDLSEAIRATLEPRVMQLVDGNAAVFEFWFCKQVPLKAKPESPEKALDTLKQATLLGAVVVSRTQRDYREDELGSGTYTVRFALQPKDTNHEGTTDFRYFALLVPSKYDAAPDAITEYKRVVKLAARDTASEHPRNLSVRPLKDEAEVPRLVEPVADHKSLRVKLPGKVIDQDERATIAFDIVYHGLGHK